MTSQSSSVSQTMCHVTQVQYILPEAICDRCAQPAARFTTAQRTAIDIDLNHPVLLHLIVSVHHCACCDHYFRAQPPFLRRDAIYSSFRCEMR
jgi:hypothetical protein